MLSSCNHTESLHESCARLTIYTQRAEIVIDILGTVCKLVKPNLKQCADLIGVALTPGELLTKLQRRGITLNPFYSDSERMDGNVAKVSRCLEETIANEC